MKAVYKDTGFTLIEMAIIILIVGIITAYLLSTEKSYEGFSDIRDTRENLVEVQQYIRNFYSVNRRYPCPADPTLNRNNPNYGLEVCRAPNNNQLTDPPAPGIFYPPLPIVGGRDANQDGVTDSIAIGVVPVRTLEQQPFRIPFKAEMARDAYGNVFSYAVSEFMTNAGTANLQLGAITILDENGQNATTPPSSAHYIVFSHGQSQRGAYTVDGALVQSCSITAVPGDPPTFGGPGFIPGGLPPDMENCDNQDAIFISGLRSYRDDNSFFDDQVVFDTRFPQSLWANAGANRITNTNFGDVAVGPNNTDPSERLHILDEPIQTAPTASTLAEGMFCDEDGNDCFDPNIFDQAGMPIEGGGGINLCPPGQAARAIQNGELQCAPVNIDFSGFAPCNAAANEFVRGFRSVGGNWQIVCAVPD